MENFIRMTIFENAIEAQIIESILNERNIPHRIRSFADTAFDGLFQVQKGWGELFGPPEKREEIIEIVRDVRSDG